MTIYIASRPLNRIGLWMAGLSILLLLITLMEYHYSGSIVAEAKLDSPVTAVPATEQLVAAHAEKLVRNTLRKAGLPTLDTDKVEWLGLTFDPVRLLPNMGEISLQLKLYENGAMAATATGPNPTYGQQIYEVMERSTGKIIFKSESLYRPEYDISSNGFDAIINVNDRKVSTRVKKGDAWQVVGRFTPPAVGDYVLKVWIQKLRYAHPITDAKLLVKTGMIDEPKPVVVLSFAGIIALGIFLFVITTPPELRKRKK